MSNVKWPHVGSFTVVSIGGTVCGAAPDINSLIIGRAVAGTDGGRIYLGPLNLIAIKTTARERTAYIGGAGPFREQQ